MFRNIIFIFTDECLPWLCCIIRVYNVCCESAQMVNNTIFVHLLRVVGGLDTLDKMEKVKTDDKDRPVVRY